MASGQVLQVSTKNMPATPTQQQQVVVSGTVTIPHTSQIGMVSNIQPFGIAAQGYASDPLPPPAPVSNTPGSKSKNALKRKLPMKKNAPVLPKTEAGPNTLPTIVPKFMSQTGQQISIAQPQVLTNQQIIGQDGVMYQTVQDQQNPENKVFVKTLLAKKIRHNNVIIQQPVQGVMNVQNVDFGAGGDGQTVQFQTSFPQAVQQTFIQYASPASSVQSVPAIIQQPTQQASNVQTYIVQPNGEMYMQSQVQTSNLGTQMMVTPQSIMMPQQQQIMVSQQPMLGQQQQQVFIQQSQPGFQQPQMMHTTQFLSQPQNVVAGQQVLIQSQPQLIASQSLPVVSSLSSSAASFAQSSSTVSSVCFIPTYSVASMSSSSSSTIVTNTIDSNTSASQDVVVHSTEGKSSSSDNTQSDIGQHNSANGLLKSNETNSTNPSTNETNNSSAGLISEQNNTVNVTGSETVSAELASAVGSIMEDSNDSQDNVPVMIENDGNELLFEQQQNYQMCATSDNSGATAEVYGEDSEAAMAVEQLEHNQDQTEDAGVTGDVNDDSVLILDDGDNDEAMEGVECSETPEENPMIEGEALTNGDVEMNGGEDYKEGSVEKEAFITDEELIAKFRAETPINVPIVSENGLYEQDFEARMAVEGLLKDVEFNVHDEDSGQGNVVFQSQTSQSMKTGDSNCVQEMDSNETDESQNNTSSKGGKSVETSKSKSQVDHSKMNGLDSLDEKHLMNGDFGSPDSQSVPSPTVLVNGGGKLVNGDLTEDRAVDKMLKINGVVNHRISNNVQDTKSEADVESKTSDILAQSLSESNIDNVDDDENSQSAKLDKNGDKVEDQSNSDSGDILAKCIQENGIELSDCEMPEEPAGVNNVVKQFMPGTFMTLQFNNTSIPITFTTNPIVTTKAGQPLNVCSSRHVPTPESARDGDVSCDSTASSIATSEICVSVNDKHSSNKPQTKSGAKDSKSKPLASPKGGESKKKSSSSSKKRSRSKSGGSAGSDTRPTPTTSPGVAAAPLPEYQCEWAGCRQ